ncbi:MAG: hypothetical protein K6T83_03665 [Alicyclobacillus sp.]|nr:hypothetical protein [Alicyclobacillus sp.]
MIQKAIELWLVTGLMVIGILFGTGAMTVWFPREPTDESERQRMMVGLFFCMLWWTILWPRTLGDYLRK